MGEKNKLACMQITLPLSTHLATKEHKIYFWVQEMVFDLWDGHDWYYLGTWKLLRTLVMHFCRRFHLWRQNLHWPRKTLIWIKGKCQTQTSRHWCPQGPKTDWNSFYTFPNTKIKGLCSGFYVINNKCERNISVQRKPHNSVWQALRNL